jgi:excisionase family DNA binding protein
MPDLSASNHDRGPPLLTLPQVAHDLSVSRRTLERLIAAGEFPAPVKIGRSSRILPADLAGYLEKLRQGRGDKLGTS